MLINNYYTASLRQPRLHFTGFEQHTTRTSVYTNITYLISKTCRYAHYLYQNHAFAFFNPQNTYTEPSTRNAKCNTEYMEHYVSTSPNILNINKEWCYVFSTHFSFNYKKDIGVTHR